MSHCVINIAELPSVRAEIVKLLYYNYYNKFGSVEPEPNSNS
jgi:hypothetical protein